MNASLKRRMNFLHCWATTRISLLDGFERYEDSFAIAEEFREWITCIGEHPEMLDASVLKVPNFTLDGKFEKKRDSDEMLEI